jgi:hypothetical protein
MCCKILVVAVGCLYGTILYDRIIVVEIYLYPYHLCPITPPDTADAVRRMSLPLLKYYHLSLCYNDTYCVMLLDMLNLQKCNTCDVNVVVNCDVKLCKAFKYV